MRKFAPEKRGYLRNREIASVETDIPRLPRSVAIMRVAKLTAIRRYIRSAAIYGGFRAGQLRTAMNGGATKLDRYDA